MAALDPMQKRPAQMGGIAQQYPPGRGALSIEGLEVNQGGAQPVPGARSTPGALTAPEQPGQAQAPDIQENPEIARQVARESAQVAKRSPGEAKEQINQEMRQTFGEDSIQTAYQEMLEKLGGEKSLDVELSKDDWGLFLMDFGMRMMAYASQPGGTLGGAIGQAGTDLISNVTARRGALQEQAADINAERRETALGMADYEMTRRDSALDPDNVLWTDKGAYNMRTGEYMKGPEGGVLQPGMKPGAGNRMYSGELKVGRLIDAGFSPAAAAAIESGAQHPAEVAARAREEIADAIAGGDSVMVDGERVRARNLTNEQKRRYIQQAVEEVATFYEGTGGNTPALVEPGPAAEGRQ